MIKPIKLYLAGIFFMLSFPLHAQEQQELDPDVYAIINGVEIPLELITTIIGANQVPDDQLVNIMDRIVTNILVAQEAENTGLADDPEINTQLLLARYQILSQAFIANMLEDIEVSEDEIQARYELITEQRAEEKEYDAYHILVETEDEAIDLIAEIDGDFEQFKELAQVHSLDTNSGTLGGALGWSSANTFVPDFADALRELTKGEVTAEPVETQFGWHVIYLDDLRDFEMPTLDDQQRQQIIEAIENDAILSELERLRGEAEIILNSALPASN